VELNIAGSNDTEKLGAELASLCRSMSALILYHVFTMQRKQVEISLKIASTARFLVADERKLLIVLFIS